MYGFARGVAPSRDVAGSMQNAQQDESPPLSGINAPGNSLTMQGPATEPAVNDVEAQRRNIAMLLAGRAMSGMGAGMAKSGMPPMMAGANLDIYGNPIL